MTENRKLKNYKTDRNEMLANLMKTDLPDPKTQTNYIEEEVSCSNGFMSSWRLFMTWKRA
jgi:hypothetical protein